MYTSYQLSYTGVREGENYSSPPFIRWTRSSKRITSGIVLNPKILCQHWCLSMSIRSRLFWRLLPPLDRGVRWCSFLPLNLRLRLLLRFPLRLLISRSTLLNRLYVNCLVSNFFVVTIKMIPLSFVNNNTPLVRLCYSHWFFAKWADHSLSDLQFISPNHKGWERLSRIL